MFWLLLIVLTIILALFYRMTSKYGQLEKKGFHSLKPFPLDLNNFFLGKPIFDKNGEHVYRKLDGHSYGIIYQIGEPSLVVRDPEIIKLIMVKDNQYFMNRVASFSQNMQKTHPELKQNLFLMENEKWRTQRQSTSIVFSSSKMSSIVPSLNACRPGMLEFIEKKRLENVSDPDVVEMQDIFFKYTVTAISRTIFGLLPKVYEESDDFYKYSMMMSATFNLRQVFNLIMWKVSPSLAKALNMKVVHSEAHFYFHSLAKEVMKHNKLNENQNNEMYKTMLQHFVDIDGLDEETIVQSVTTFFVGGFDTVSNALSIMCYYTALNPDVQNKAYEEIEQLDKGCNEDLNYDDLSRLEYLEMIMSESLRLTPITLSAQRICTNDYTLPEGQTIPKGMLVSIPTQPLHSDPKYWDEPEKFRPERHSRENKNSIVPFSYLPFGGGPRNCIGRRLALVEIKFAFYNLLKNYRLEPSSRTPVPIQLEKYSLINKIRGGNWLRLVAR